MGRGQSPATRARGRASAPPAAAPPLTERQLAAEREREEFEARIAERDRQYALAAQRQAEAMREQLARPSPLNVDNRIATAEADLALAEERLANPNYAHSKRAAANYRGQIKEYRQRIANLTMQASDRLAEVNGIRAGAGLRPITRAELNAARRRVGLQPLKRPRGAYGT